LAFHNRIDLRKPHARFVRAYKAQSQMCGIVEISEFEDHWFDFLLAMEGFFNQMKRAVKPNPQARQWFGSKERERRTDPLLRYVQAARNAEEHKGIKLFDVVPGQVSIGGPGEQLHLDMKANVSGRPTFIDNAGNPVTVVDTPPTSKIVPVTCRGVVYEPPTSHLGKELESDQVSYIAALGVVYLRSVLLEASRFS
jgi:hypothetical protein